MKQPTALDAGEFDPARAVVLDQDPEAVYFLMKQTWVEWDARVRDDQTTRPAAALSLGRAETLLEVGLAPSRRGLQLGPPIGLGPLKYFPGPGPMVSLPDRQINSFIENSPEPGILQCGNKLPQLAEQLERTVVHGVIIYTQPFPDTHYVTSFPAFGNLR